MQTHIQPTRFSVTTDAVDEDVVVGCVKGVAEDNKCALNLSKHGVGWSWGISGFRYGESPTGQRYISMGFPGTGLYFIKHLGKGSMPVPTPPIQALTGIPPSPPPTKQNPPWWKQRLD